MFKISLRFCLAALLLFVTNISFAQVTLPETRVEKYELRVGPFDNDRESELIAASEVVYIPDARWMRLILDDVTLDELSSLRMTSLEDGGTQTLDAVTIEQWNSKSAIFNGDSVLIDLILEPGASAVGFLIDDVVFHVPNREPEKLQTLCGADNRVTSLDNRVGRLYVGGCSAWGITNGAFLTAGHCVDLDPDGSGSGLPDGMIDLNGVVEFNVPQSQSNGTTIAAAPADQYAIDTSSLVWRFDGAGEGLGKDWGVFAVFPNTQTGLLPHEAYGLPLRVTRENPVLFDSIRITGFGGDSTPLGSSGGGNFNNFTNQTSLGPYVVQTTSGSNIWHNYNTDTAGGNSGSPIIWENFDVAVGIHTNGGCDPGGASGSNSGTSFEVNALESAINNFLGNGTVHLDGGFPISVLETGTVMQPFSNFATAYGAGGSGSTLAIVQGNYPVANPLVLSSPRTIVATCGSVVIDP